MRSGSASSSGAKIDPIGLTIRVLLYDLQLIPAFCVMFVCMPLTIKKLFAMRKNIGGNDREFEIVAIYILIITLISLMCLVPLYVVRHAKNSVPQSVSQPLRFLHDGYGVLNIVVYGIMNKKYRETFRLVSTKISASCRCEHNSTVGPITDNLYTCIHARNSAQKKHSNTLKNKPRCHHQDLSVLTLCYGKIQNNMPHCPMT